METQSRLPYPHSSCRVPYAILRRYFVLIFFFLTQFNFKIHKITATTQIGGNETDRLALLAFKSKIEQDPQSILSSWNNSIHFCKWQGVLCGPKHRRVTILDLSSKGLAGSLSPEIGNMSFLREIRLQNNALQGEIPQELGHLPRLKVLHLGNNSLDCEIPANISACSNLVVLNVDNNKLGGKIPAELASLSKLKELSFGSNALTGGIPPSLGNLTFLENFTAVYNNLEGSVPDALGNLKNLKRLRLGANDLSGIIPSSMFNSSSLLRFSVAQNNLQGSFPADLGFTLPSLRWLQAWGNHLSGSIPLSLSNASTLQLIDVGENNFTGKVRVDFGSMEGLVNLNIGNNALGSGEADEMNFLDSLANLSSINFLDFSKNRFEGVLPDSIANFSTQLETLSLAFNRLIGYLPRGIGNLVNLTNMDLQSNYFSGTIPSEIGHLRILQRLYLSHNEFSGKLPSSFGNLSFLTELHLDNNQLQGSIPSILDRCQNLLLLNLSHNNLNGTIPKELFAIQSMSISLNLAQNYLVGALPSEIGNLFNLGELDVSGNMLSGEIPNDLGKCSSLERLYMESNRFQGTIASSLASLRGLINVDLSQNNFSGKIPIFLGKFALLHLNLSFNNFDGEVPMEGIFSNASAISVEGNKKLCGGTPELQLPRCQYDGSKERRSGKFSLVKITVIAVACVFVVALLSAFLWFRKKSERPPAMSLMKPFRKVSYKSIMKATDGFSSANLVGVGSFGCVYRGIFEEDGATIAIKVLNLQQLGACRSFMAECRALRNVRHRNIVKVVTTCSSIDYQGNEFKAIVYEFMHNGSLENWLHPNSETNTLPVEKPSLSLLQRLSIAIDIANALHYLHNHCQKPIFHSDLKPSNILLDSDMTAHVGDFGLARFGNHITGSSQSSSTAVRGTIGYTAPEYGLGSELSTSGDVYSFGIILLETMTGKRPTNNMFHERLNLHHFAKMAIPDQISEIVDPTLLNDKATDATEDLMIECLIALVRIGVACSMESPRDRMGISNVVNELHNIRNVLFYEPSRINQKKRF